VGRRDEERRAQSRLFATLLTGIFDLYGAMRKEKVLRVCSHAWIGHERIASNPIPLTPMSATPFWHGSRGTSLTGVHWLFFLFWTGVRHGEAAALRWNDIDLKRGIISIARSRDEGEDNAPKTAGSTREIPMLPWVVDLLKRLTRRLHSDGSEFVFLSPEGKPMTDTWWPKRGAARRPVNDESKGIWFRCLRSLGIRPRKFYMTRHTFIAWALFGGSQFERAC